MAFATYPDALLSVGLAGMKLSMASLSVFTVSVVRFASVAATVVVSAGLVSVLALVELPPGLHDLIIKTKSTMTSVIALVVRRSAVHGGVPVVSAVRLTAAVFAAVYALVIVVKIIVIGIISVTH